MSIPAHTENKFGMFVHWGFYSLLETQEQALARFDMDNREYEQLMYSFNPEKFDADELVLLAKNAGMKYICVTAKHHDGFCMWDTKYTAYNIMNTPYKRDILKMIADACGRHDMLFSIYYSNPDWHEPCGYNEKSSHQWKSVCPAEGDSVKYREFVKNQITELLTNYGPVYTLFWDIPPRYEDKSINGLARKLMPGILINNRGYDEGDFATPEREVPEGNRFTKMTEACQSVGEQSWGYRADEDYYSARFLMSSVGKIMAMGGSYLLNIGPKGDGTIPEPASALIKKVGDWYNRTNGCLEGTEADAFAYDFIYPQPCITLTKNGKSYFVFYEGVRSSAVSFKVCPGVPKQARLMNSGKTLRVRYEKLPGVFDGKTGRAKGPFVSITGIDADKFSEEPIILEIEW